MKCNDFIKYARNKIAIERQVLATDAFGGQLQEWENINATADKLLLESGDFLLLEGGGSILLESTSESTAQNYWAWIKPVTTSEQIVNFQLRSECTHKFIIRYDSKLANTKITGSYRIVFENRIYNIEGIKNFDNTLKNYGTIYQEIMATENEVEYVS